MPFAEKCWRVMSAPALACGASAAPELAASAAARSIRARARFGDQRIELQVAEALPPGGARPGGGRESCAGERLARSECRSIGLTGFGRESVEAGAGAAKQGGEQGGDRGAESGLQHVFPGTGERHALATMRLSRCSSWLTSLLENPSSS
jgi:hypothetical protein